MKNINKIQVIKNKELSSIFKSHFYWCKEHIEAVMSIIKLFTNKGDTIADPFCGSGTTGIAAKLLSRNIFISDISPASFYLSRGILTTVQPDILKNEFEIFYQHIQNLIGSFYFFKCPSCKNKATIKYRIIENNGDSFHYYFKPVGSIVYCSFCRKKHFIKMDASRDNFSILGDNMMPSDILSPEAHGVLEKLWSSINDYKQSEIKYKLIYAFILLIRKVSLLRNKNGIIKQLHEGAFPQIIHEKNILDAFKTVSNDIQKANRYLYKYRTSQVLMNLNSSDNLTFIDDKSIDLCYFDIPYGSDYLFSNYNQIWEKWFDKKTEKKSEIYFIEHNKDSYDHYYKKLASTFEEGHRILKKDKLMVIPFSMRYEYIFPLVNKAVLDVGFKPVIKNNYIHNHIKITNKRSMYYLLLYKK
jgi:DNA modification methylase